MSQSPENGSRCVHCGRRHQSSEQRPVGQKEAMYRISSQELAGLSDRISHYYEELRKADRVVVVIGCDDGRVLFPIHTQEEMGAEGQTERVMYVYLPKIGSGVPEAQVLMDARSEVRSIVGDDKPISFMVTQHGHPSKEVDLLLAGNEPLELTCGLRAVFSAHTEELSQIGSMLRAKQLEEAWIEDLNTDETQDIYTRLLALEEKTSVPALLLLVAAAHNFSGSLFENLEAVQTRVAELIGEPVTAVIYDHNQKQLIYVESRTEAARVNLDVKPWEESHQDPAGLIVSYGRKNLVIADGIVLPESIGEGESNDFAAAATGDWKKLVKALAEVWYAASHFTEHQEHKGHGKNFKNVQFCAIHCDDAVHVEEAKKALRSEYFVKKLLPAYRALGEIQLIDVSTGTVELFSLSV